MALKESALMPICPDSSLLVVFAMKEEAQGLFEAAGIPVLYTGLGKVNAAFRLTEELMKGRRPRLVVNFGTAGSASFRAHDLIEVARFVQRDMDASALGFAPGTTPFDEAPAVLESRRVLPLLPGGTCGSGDSFETGRPKVSCDVVDMEAFALAKVCHHLGIPFVSVKYITDGSDKNAHEDWAANLPKAAARFLEVYRELEKISQY